jgi:branched-subunit amino acid ABC-type transport system permease component
MTAAILGIDSIRELAQAAVNGLINGSSYGLLAVGFALILSVTARFHFAFAFTYAFAACFCAVLQGDHGVPLLPAIVIAIAAATILGALCEPLVYRPLAERAGGSALLPVFVSSLGLAIAGEQVIRLLWGSASRTLTGVSLHTVSVGGVTFTTFDIAAVLISSVLCVGVAVILASTRLGRQIRAARVNPLMSLAIGIDLRRAYAAAFVIGSALGGVAAILEGIKFAVEPDMGIRPVFYALVVAFLAGSASSPLKLLLTGLGVGVVENLAGIWMNTQLSTAVVFALLFAYLSYRSLRLALAERPRRGAGNRARRRLAAAR